MFYDILEKKKAFQSYKNEKFKSRKIGIFSKGLVHDFDLKLSIFPSFHFMWKKAAKMFFTIFLKKKKAVLNYKYKKFKKSKDHNISKGVSPWFWSKIVNFYIF